MMCRYSVIPSPIYVGALVFFTLSEFASAQVFIRPFLVKSPKSDSRELVVLEQNVSQDQASNPAIHGIGAGIPLDFYSTLRLKIVQKEIGFSDEQLRQIKSRQREFLDYATVRYEKIVNRRIDLFEENEDEFIRTIEPERIKLQKHLWSQSEVEFADVLLKHQMDRLQQLQVQLNIRRLGLAKVLTSDSISKRLGLSSEQIKEIAKVNAKTSEVIKAFSEKQRQIEYRESKAVLNAKQAGKLLRKKGAEFKWE